MKFKQNSFRPKSTYVFDFVLDPNAKKSVLQSDSPDFLWLLLRCDRSVAHEWIEKVMLATPSRSNLEPQLGSYMLDTVIVGLVALTVG